MEEILASIRRIIADDDASKPAKAPETAAPPKQPPSCRCSWPSGAAWAASEICNTAAACRFEARRANAGCNR